MIAADCNCFPSSVAYLEASSELRVPSSSALSPRNIWHLARVDVRINARLAARHVAVHLHSIVHHAEVRVDPIVT